MAPSATRPRSWIVNSAVVAFGTVNLRRETKATSSSAAPDGLFQAVANEFNLATFIHPYAILI
jgi:hypothetical protein